MLMWLSGWRWLAGQAREHLERTRKELVLMTEIVAELQAAIREQADVVTSAIELVKQLADLVEANIDDPESLHSILDELRANTQGLADAVATYTPSEEPPPEEDGTVPPPGGGGDGGGGATTI